MKDALANKSSCKYQSKAKIKFIAQSLFTPKTKMKSINTKTGKIRISKLL